MDQRQGEAEASGDGRSRGRKMKEKLGCRWSVLNAHDILSKCGDGYVCANDWVRGTNLWVGLGCMIRRSISLY